MPYMANRSAIILLLALFVVAGFFTQRISSKASAAEAPAGKGPVVVELFTSEGCSSCPPADALLRDFDSAGKVEGVEVISLGWHVDYWDRLGWKDRFSSADFTHRQQQYAEAFGSDQVYTPQMVIDGRAEFVGSDGRKARATILNASRLPKASVSLAVQHGPAGRARVEAEVRDLPPSTKEATALLLITERNLQSEVRAGENQGSTLKHSGVVRLVQPAGKVAPGKPQHLAVEVTLERSWKPQDLRAILLLQDARDRTIVGAAGIPLQ